MRKLRDITTRLSLAELVEALDSTISTTEVQPEPRPEGEKKFVAVHKTEKHPDRAGNKGDVRNGEKQKHYTFKEKPKPGFPPEVKEEEEIDEAAGIGRAMAKSANPLIKRPKFDAHGNVVLTRDAKKNIEYGKKPRSRKLTGQPYTGKKAFGEDKEIEEGRDNWGHGRTSKTRKARAKAGPNFPTVLVSPKGEKGGGKVTRIPKGQYDPKKHSLAEEQIDEKNWIAGAIKKPGALTRSAKKAGESTSEFAQAHKHEGGKTGQRSRLALTLKKLNKEETEPLDELKKETLGRYISGRSGHLAASAYSAGGYHATNRPDDAVAQTKRAQKYHTGIKRAAERIGGTYETGKPLRVMIPGKEDNDKASGPYTMKRKKLYHGEETQLDEAGPTKKHFQMAADSIKAISDEGKRKEHAHAHADLYSKQNPRFDRGKFLKAAGVNEETEIDEEDKKRLPLEYRRKAATDIRQNQNQIRGRYTPKSFQSTRDKIAKARYAQMNKEETQLDEVSAPGEETWIKHRKGEGGFKKRYGERWKNVLYATAWKRSKHNYPKG